MNKLMVLLLALATIANVQLNAQMNGTMPEDQISASELKADLYWLASDYLQGRRTGSEGNNIAAKFIASQIEAAGFKPAPGQDTYFQPINFEQTQPPASATLELNKTAYSFKEDFIILRGDANSFPKAKGVYAGHGMEADYKDLDVKGKVVFVMGGEAENRSNQATFNAMSVKRKLAAEKGAVGLIEIYNLSFPWNFFASYFGGKSISLPSGGNNDKGGDIIYGWMQAKTDSDEIKKMREGGKVKINLASSGFSKKILPSQNVVGVLEGTDPELKDEYIVLSAHYDHVGVGKEGGGAITPTDSIFNGARDNGAGTVSLLATARALGKVKPKRSVIFFACTAEEVGLLGSRYYADNPLIPLNKTIFNLNIDNAGYNDTSIVTIFGYGRTGTDEKIQEATNTYGLKAIADPAPEQNLFDRSDNVSFAAKGVPAFTFSLGFTAFDEEINKYYHQVTDNPDNMDYEYLEKYARSYARLARMIANDPNRPQWKPGDKYEAAGKKLYGDR
ncbi:MAG: M28 family peptidase [Bacteroidota bacterium]